MKKIITVVSIMALCSCNRSGNAPEIRTPANYLYGVINNVIVSYSIDPGTGFLTPISGSNFAMCANCQPQFFDSVRNLIFFQDTVSNYIYVAAVDGATGRLNLIQKTNDYASTGVLVPGSLLFTLTTATTIRSFSYSGSGVVENAGSPFTIPVSMNNSLITDPLQRFIFGKQVGTGIVTYLVNGTNSPTYSSILATSDSPYVVDSTDRYLIGAGLSTLDIFTINQSTGALSAGPSYSVSGVPTMDLANHFVFQFLGGGPSVTVFRLNNGGTLTQLATTAVSGDSSIRTDPSGRFVYNISTTLSSIFVYSVDQNTGALNLVQSVATATTFTGPLLLGTFYH